MEFLIIENNLERALKFENLGIETIFIDLEQLGKQERQGHIDSVKSKHKVSDIVKIKAELNKSEILVRIDPVNPDTKKQIEDVILAGADIIMLPFFTTFEEVEYFFSCIDGRVKTKLLFEHIDSLPLIGPIHKKFSLNEVYFGLNDLSLSIGYNFMFSVLTNRILDNAISYCKLNNIKFGIGGIGSYNSGKIPGKLVLREYKRLGATSTILSRGIVSVFNENENTFIDEVNLLRKEWDNLNVLYDESVLNQNFISLKKLVNEFE
tara:strand:- start:12 stop:803 length:792 start_codon:yes stop_codon:yes gene_type:complete